MDEFLDVVVLPGAALVGHRGRDGEVVVVVYDPGNDHFDGIGGGGSSIAWLVLVLFLVLMVVMMVMVNVVWYCRGCGLWLGCCGGGWLR